MRKLRLFQNGETLLIPVQCIPTELSSQLGAGHVVRSLYRDGGDAYVFLGVLVRSIMYSLYISASCALFCTASQKTNNK